MNFLRNLFGKKQPTATSSKIEIAEDVPSQQVQMAKEAIFVQRCLERKFEEKDETRDYTSSPEFGKVLQYLSRKDYQNVCTEVARLVPDFNNLDLLYVWQGEALVGMEAYEEARQVLKQGLERSNRKFLLCYTLGEVEWKAGNLEEAVYWWVQALHCQETLKGRGNDHLAYLYLYYVADEMKLSVASRFLLYADWIQPGQVRLVSTAEMQLRNLVRRGQTSGIKEVLIRVSERYLAGMP